MPAIEQFQSVRSFSHFSHHPINLQNAAAPKNAQKFITSPAQWEWRQCFPIWSVPNYVTTAPRAQSSAVRHWKLDTKLYINCTALFYTHKHFCTITTNHLCLKSISIYWKTFSHHRVNRRWGQFLNVCRACCHCILEGKRRKDRRIQNHPCAATEWFVLHPRSRNSHPL